MLRKECSVRGEAEPEGKACFRDRENMGRRREGERYMLANEKHEKEGEREDGGCVQ